jgi:hypothetical protein
VAGQVGTVLAAAANVQIRGTGLPVLGRDGDREGPEVAADDDRPAESGNGQPEPARVRLAGMRPPRLIKQNRRAPKNGGIFRGKVSP